MAALLEQAGATAPDHLVWADPRTHRYYLRGCPEFRKTPYGCLMYVAEVRALGYKMAYHE